MNSDPSSIHDALDKLTFLPDRTPATEDGTGFAGRVADYRDGGIFVAHYAGNSEWERHRVGDEIVMVVEGETTLILLIDDVEIRNRLGPSQLLVVPRGVWHRFESPTAVKVLTVTPQPTDHTVDRPTDS